MSNLMNHHAVPHKAWLKILAAYRTPDVRRSLVELAFTLTPLIGLWFLTWMAIEHGHWYGIILVIPAAGFLLRLFILPA